MCGFAQNDLFDQYRSTVLGPPDSNAVLVVVVVVVVAVVELVASSDQLTHLLLEESHSLVRKGARRTLSRRMDRTIVCTTTHVQFEFHKCAHVVCFCW